MTMHIIIFNNPVFQYGAKWIGSLFHRSVILTLLAGIFALSNATAADIDEAITAVEQEDYFSAYQTFKKLAEQGNAEAQHNLAILYRQGKGVMQDQQKAFTWFQKAADQGLASSQFNLGYMYDNGVAVDKNTQSAADWYKKAAQQGNPSAQANLAVLYANGDGIGQDIILAYVWSTLAASQGVKAALDNRNLISKGMSESLIANAKKLSSEYFQRYVEPFAHHTKKMMNGPLLPQGHQ